MVVSAQVAGLAMSVVSGSIKLGKKLDVMMAAQLADSSPMSLPFTDVAGAPVLGDLEEALRDILERTQDAPDQLSQAERGRIETALANPKLTPLMRLCEKHFLMDSIAIDLWSPDAAFQEALFQHRQVWDLDESDIRRATYYLVAGPSARRNSLGFRIAAAVLDVVSDVAGQNAHFITDHPPTQELVQAVLTRFSEPELETMSGWGAVLQHALRSTLEAAIDQRENIAANSVWAQHALSALARAREVGEEDFVLGLLNGSGFQHLIRGVLEAGSSYLSEGDEEVWESVLANVLTAAAQKIEPASEFESYFQENWHVLVGAGLGSLAEHGPQLIGSDKLLTQVLTASVGALADSFSQGPPGKEVVDAAVRAAVGVFADKPVLDGLDAEEWLKDLIGSTATLLSDTISEDGLRGVFSRAALENYARGTLVVLSDYPEVIGGDSQLVQAILKDVLGSMARVENFAVASLADVAVQGALTAMADNPDLFESKYASVYGQLAGKLAEQVALGGLSGLQAQDLLEAAAETIATNDELFVQKRDQLAQAVVEAVLETAKGDEKGLLAGTALVATIQRSLDVVATFGLGLPAQAEKVRDRLHEALAAALKIAAEKLGRGLAQSDLPDALVTLVAELSKAGPVPEPGTPGFTAYFEALLAKVSVAPV